jgi:hypothetical protein
MFTRSWLHRIIQKRDDEQYGGGTGRQGQQNAQWYLLEIMYLKLSCICMDRDSTTPQLRFFLVRSAYGEADEDTGFSEGPGR